MIYIFKDVCVVFWPYQFFKDLIISPKAPKQCSCKLDFRTQIARESREREGEREKRCNAPQHFPRLLLFSHLLFAFFLVLTLNHFAPSPLSLSSACALCQYDMRVYARIYTYTYMCAHRHIRSRDDRASSSYTHTNTRTHLSPGFSGWAGIVCASSYYLSILIPLPPSSSSARATYVRARFHPSLPHTSSNTTVWLLARS